MTEYFQHIKSIKPQVVFKHFKLKFFAVALNYLSESQRVFVSNNEPFQRPLWIIRKHEILYKTY
jgi:hypothetical protein